MSGTRPAKPWAAPGQPDPWASTSNATNKGTHIDYTTYIDTSNRIQDLAVDPAEVDEALNAWTENTIVSAFETLHDQALLLGRLTEDLPFDGSILYGEYGNDATADSQLSILLPKVSTHAQLVTLPNKPGNTSSQASSSSSLVVITPPSKSADTSSRSERAEAVSSDAPLPRDLYDKVASSWGPCSNTWQLRQWRTRVTKKMTTGQSRKRGHEGVGAQQRRRPFEDPQQRDQTALTRNLKACIRCRMQKKRCKPNPDDPFGPCLTCAAISGPTLSGLDCLRYKITDAALYREQEAPFHMWSKRWKNMDLVDIADWASDEIKTITVSQIFLDAPYEVRVKRFIPREGDMVEDAWFQNGTMRKYEIPCYALCDMTEAANMLVDFIDRNVVNYIGGALKDCDTIIRDTYSKAFVHAGEAQV
ncbi:hypothetical protein LTR48_006201 [Friedmanniomyces endolithicus]|uniref:Zn(2)-C6 fungal-type domain-containing protein n=1 Tax=Rachicladosporium monterosium TaxID=1507873 RepID=A0ABR0L158_9PEZI|nr:hypothetical protein LTR48_006201 [Friedmanniomyces endolithicus]KAK5141242.1 hypothetical protein LTR32_006152 [Rachicladosporium monterosium]